ncbi:nuclear transport factor 2 family protein [Natrialbaceae archaeon GCM10025810]|uniref:nuclear transport factor 2 family protein n=1 Tax=Halovalidus salilacus TaxID=3075124 RepID=UPI0036061689
MSTVERELLDRIEIRELRAKYSRAIDYEEYEQASDIFTDDAVVHYSNGTCRGTHEVERYWREKVAYDFSMHTVTMPEISIEGDTATGEWYLLVFYRTPDGRDGTVMGWYEDEYRCVGGEWRIAEIEMDLTHDTTDYHL